MSTRKSSSSDKQGQSDSGKETGAGAKRKSAGFIETSGFKPNWLETGPLSPEMLPDAMPDEESSLTTDEYEVLRQSLQKFYQEEGIEVPEAQPVVAEPEVESASGSVEPDESQAIAAMGEVVMTEPEAVVTAEASALPEEVMAADMVQEPTVLPPPPDLWIEPLLHREETADEPVQDSPALMASQPVAADPAADVFVDPIWDAEADPMAEVSARPVEAIPTIDNKGNRKRAPKSRAAKHRSRVANALFIFGLLLFGAAALIYFVNPFTRLALGSASLARPLASPTTGSPRSGSGNWCIQGNFQSATAAPLRLIDSGAGGDILAEDNVYSLDHSIVEPGSYEWQVIDCDNPALIFPEAPAWVMTTEPDQPVTFIFDGNEREDRLFFPIPYVVSATDSAADFQIVGNFQEWNPDDPAGRLEQISPGLYQQVRRIARAGEYEGHVVAGDKALAIDAYGRTTRPIPFSFQTDRNGDYVIFLVDTDRGRASVMYDMPPVFTSLAFGNGYRLLSFALAILASLIWLGLLLRYLILNNRTLQLETGCPNCGRRELMRIARHPSDRFLHVFGIPAYRYRCRHCTWEGMRLSEEGAAISSGIETAANTRF